MEKAIRCWKVCKCLMMDNADTFNNCPPAILATRDHITSGYDMSGNMNGYASERINFRIVKNISGYKMDTEIIRNILISSLEELHTTNPVMTSGGINAEFVVEMYEKHYEKFCELENLLFHNSIYELDKLKQKIAHMEEMLNELSNKIMYTPDGMKYENTKQHFEQLKSGVTPQ